MATIAAVALAGGMSLTSGLVATAADEVTADPESTATVAYSRIPAERPQSYQSLPFQSRQAQEMGQVVQFAEGTPRDLDAVEVFFVNWACETGIGATCLTTPGATFTIPITVNVWEVAGTEEAPAVGALITSITEDTAIAYRPSADERCEAGRFWAEGIGEDGAGGCANGYSVPISFDTFPSVELPDQVVVSVRFDTQNTGAGEGPWNSLNIAVDSNILWSGEPDWENLGTVPPLVGSEPEAPSLFHWHSHNANKDIPLIWNWGPDLDFTSYSLLFEVRTTDAVPVPDTAAYSRLPLDLAPSYPSLGFQATQIHELANVVSLADGPSRELTEVEVAMVSWACETGSGVTCATTPGATFTHPITVSLYEVAGTAEVPAPGALIASRTIQADMAYRPSASLEQCPDGRWYDEASATCNNGFAYPLVFDNFGDVTLPDDVVVGIRYETFNTIGVHGPFESMNVGVELNRTAGVDPAPIAPRLGTEPTVDSLIRWSSTNPDKGVPLIWPSRAQYSPILEIRTTLEAEATLTAPAEVYALQDVTPVVAVSGAGIPVDGTVTVAVFVGEGAATCTGEPAETVEVAVADLATADLPVATALPGTMGITATVNTFRGDPVVTTECATTDVRAFFNDVGAGHSFFGQIQWLGVTGLSTGYADGSFQSNGSMSRQAMAAFMARWLGDGDLAACTVAPFTDVPVGHPFCAEIQWMKTEGLATGYSDGGFHPAASVSRQAGAAFLARLLPAEEQVTECAEAPFTDVPVGHQFCGEITALVDAGVVNGYGDDTFRPGGPMSRQAMASWIYASDAYLTN